MHTHAIHNDDEDGAGGLLGFYFFLFVISYFPNFLKCEANDFRITEHFYFNTVIL